VIGWLRNLFGQDNPPTFGGVPRSPPWPAVRTAFLAVNPKCAVCGTTCDVEAHHVQPFHLDPAMELDPNNLIALCRRDHLLFGHLGNWASFNRTVREDAAVWRRKIEQRP
jgi:5-methylcytosine-specific restriction endonuclease McrA